MQILDHARTKEQAKADGYPVFNNGPHLTLDIPDGPSTLSCVLSNGVKVTFAFCPYEENGVPRCVDIQNQNTGHVIMNGDFPCHIQKVICFTTGNHTFASKYGDDKPTTLVTLILDEPPEALRTP